MVRANGQRDGVGRTRDWASAFEHSRPILDSTRVSPYGPAAREMPQSMRPDTRQHLTACSEPSEEMSSPETGVNALRRTEDLRVVRGHLPRARSPAAVKPLRGSCAPLRPVRVTAATDRAGSLAGPANKLAPRSTEAGPGPRVPLVCLAFGRWALGMAHSPVAPCSEAPLGGAVVGPYPPRTVAGRSGVWSPPSSPCCLSESAKRGLEPREGVRGRGRAPRRLAHEARHARSPWAARQPIVHGYVTEQGKAVDRAIEVSVPSAARAFSVPVSRLGLSGGRFSI